MQLRALAMTALLLLVAARLSLGLGASDVAAKSPVGKVVEMLSEMRTKGTQEMQAENDVFAEYSRYCRDRDRELTEEIKQGTMRAEKLTAEAASAASSAEVLGGQVAEADAQLNAMGGDQKAASEQREKENTEFQTAQNDYTESLYALDKAIETLKAQGYDRPQAEAFLQRAAARGEPGMRRVLAALALLQNGDSADEALLAAPSVAAYESQTGNIISTLEELRDKFKEELNQLEKEEANSAHAYEMEYMHTANAIDNLNSKRSGLAADRADALKTAATSKGELSVTTTALTEAQTLHKDTMSTCQVKKSTYEANQVVRADELKALSTAIEILSSNKVAGNYGKHVKAMLQLPSGNKPAAPMSFLQLRGTAARSVQTAKAVAYLQTQAKSLNSKTLVELSTRLAANPFTKVVTMIENLLVRLKEEANQEADHKAYCDEELKKNKAERTKLSKKAARLDAEVEEKEAQIAAAAKEISALAKEQAELRAAMAEATSVRTKEKEENTEAIRAAKEGQVALKQAVAVLEEFYSSQGGAFTQTQQVPEMEAYTGMQNTKGGVIGMLEVIESDFRRVEADTTVAEHQAASLYEKEQADGEKTLKQKHDNEFKLSLKKDQDEFERDNLQKDLGSTRERLGQANKVYDSLKPQCVEVRVSYKERVQRREDEIAALKNAYRILSEK